MSDEEDTADPTRKSSRRDRFKGAIARTKTKLTKKDRDSDTTVDDFLSAGRGSTSTGRPSISDTLSLVSERPSTTQSHYHDANEHQYSAPVIPPPQSSPRRIVVPKIDVSTSQRYPGAQPIQQENEQTQSSLLRPEYQGRARSNSSLAKGRGRARGLSVQFVDRPPIIIGEGGDEAETPTIEVGRAKARARSVSPQRSDGATSKASRIWNKSPLQYIPRPGSLSPKPLPQQAQQPSTARPGQGSLPSPGIKRVQTGMIGASPSPISESRQAMDKEFDMSLGISPATTISTNQTISPQEPPVIHAPKPIHPPVAVPNVREMPVLHDLKSQHGTKSLRDKFTRGEGNALRQRRQDDDDDSPPSANPSQHIVPPPKPSQGAPPSSQQPQQAFAPPPGPPPNQRPPDEVFAPPPGPPPAPPPAQTSVRNGYPNQASGVRTDQAHYASQPPQHAIPGRSAANGIFAPPSHSPSQRGPPSHHPPPPPPVKPQPVRPAPDEEYTGWVRDGARPDAKPAPTVNASHFPGVDLSGKLVPHFDDEEEATPEKTKKRWFRRGS